MSEHVCSCGCRCVSVSAEVNRLYRLNHDLIEARATAPIAARSDAEGPPWCPSGFALRYHRLGECACTPPAGIDPKAVEALPLFPVGGIADPATVRLLTEYRAAVLALPAPAIAPERLDVCPDCGGDGWVVGVTTGYGCCGNFLPSGECCGNAVPVAEQTQEGCDACQGTGVLAAAQPEPTDATGEAGR